MKTVALTLALATSVAFGYAQSEAPATTSTFETTPAPETTTTFTLDEAKEVGTRALQDAKRMAEQAMQQAQHAVQMAKSKMALAENDEPARDVFEFQPGADVLGVAGRSATQPLVVRTGEIDPKTLSNIQEDLAVMSRILSKAVEREAGKDGHDSAMGIVISTLPGGRRPQSIYLEGYGALFLLNVRFPLVPPTSKDQEKSEKATDTTWEQTKRELYATQDRAGTVRIWDAAPNPGGAEYDADQVEALKKNLIESLKNAANIREVKPDESISIAVFGTRPGPIVNRIKRTYRTGGTNRGEVLRVGDAIGGKGESNLTIRAKKADIDAFAKGELDVEQFGKRVSVAAY
jgi:hypothetical protein